MGQFRFRPVTILGGRHIGRGAPSAKNRRRFLGQDGGPGGLVVCRWESRTLSPSTFSRTSRIYRAPRRCHGMFNLPAIIRLATFRSRFFAFPCPPPPPSLSPSLCTVSGVGSARYSAAFLVNESRGESSGSRVNPWNSKLMKKINCEIPRHCARYGHGDFSRRNDGRGISWTQRGSVTIGTPAHFYRLSFIARTRPRSK